MTRCCVPFCNQPGGHRFPKDIRIRNLWLKAIRRVNLVPNEGTRLCRQHFTDDDYIKMSKFTGTKHQHNYLHKCAVPSIFSWTKSNIKSAGKQTVGTHTRTSNNSSNDNAIYDESSKTLVICSVPQCNVKSTTEGVTFHPFPKNESLKKEWIDFLNVTKNITKSMKVCSLHFNKTDFVGPENEILKRNAIPTQKQTEAVLHAEENRIVEESFNKLETMSDTAETTADFEQEGDIPECRACLRKCERVNSSCDIFQGWSPPWLGMEATIAEDLAKIANIEVSGSDLYPNCICHSCYQNLLDAATFVAKVRHCNTILKQRYSQDDTKPEYDVDNNWPKPIQIDKNVNSYIYENSMEVELKQEVISDEEYCNDSTAYMELDVSNLDIKLEPEEIGEPPPMQIAINGTMSLDPNIKNPVFNGIIKDGEQHLKVEVKQEPLSEDEEDELTPDLPLGCMLCTKSFHRVSGLKAHVIAEHSYKSVKRRSSNRPSPEKKQKRDKYICQICKRSFTTSTDLMVHETCHNKYSCYGCTNLFDTFELLSKHRTRCKASLNLDAQRPKTLDDVLRSQLEHSRGNSPATHNGPVPQTDPVSDVSQVADTISDLNTNSVVDTNLRLNIKPLSDTNPVSDTSTVPNNNPGLDENELSDTNAISDTDLISDINPVSDTPQLPTSLVADTNVVSVNNEVIEMIPDKDIKTAVSMDSIAVESEQDTSDSSMKLHLEIHSANQEAEPMALSNVDVPNNVDIVESLHDDDK